MTREASGILAARTKLGLYQEASSASLLLGAAVIATLAYYPGIPIDRALLLLIALYATYLSGVRAKPGIILIASIWAYILCAASYIITGSIALMLAIAVIAVYISLYSGLVILPFLLAPLQAIGGINVSIVLMAAASVLLPLEYVRKAKLRLHQLLYSLGLAVAAFTEIYGFYLFPLVSFAAAAMTAMVALQRGYRYCPFRVEDSLIPPSLALAIVSAFLVFIGEMLGIVLLVRWGILVLVISTYSIVSALLSPRSYSNRVKDSREQSNKEQLLS